MTKKYLLEIGVEELPARLVSDTLDQLNKNCINLLNENRIGFEQIKTYSTPRRLTLLIEGLKDKQTNLNETLKGPAKRIAFDESGAPTKALMGFMRSQGIEVDQVYMEEYNGEEYVYVNLTKEGKIVEEVLPSIMIDLIKSITFPKSMKWGGKNLRFARPIRWLVSILDDNIVYFNLEDIEASNLTKGHRFLGSKEIEIKHVDEYFELLKKNYVIVDQKERKEIIKYGSEKLAKEKGGNLLPDEELLDEVTNIVEYPTPIIGRIKETYLSLPKDVITTPMKEHLRFFTVLDDKKRLLPYFITVRNGNDEFVETVIKGNEKVLGARLEDAKFFYIEDVKKSLDEYVDNLKNIVFQQKLGTLYDKTNRVQKLASKIGSYLEVGEETQNNISRAAYLSKADLVTKMVSEFTELQGKMGMEYAKSSGENEIVSLSIFEQYLPRYSGDELPTTACGSILSISDKLDSIAGLFAIGIQPTGSQDPFGLRRQALGIINIILDKKLNLSLSEFIEFALFIYVEENGLAFDYNKVKSEIMEFFYGRIKNIFTEKGIRYDIIDSVISTKTDDIYDMMIKANKLNEWLNKEGLSEILSAFNRVANLAEKATSNEVKRDLLTVDEIQLYDTFNSIEEKVIAFIKKKEYDKAIDQFIVLKDPIDNFFDKIMVMVEDENIKNNRLGLLRKIYDTMLLICDLSKIVSK